MQKYKVIFTKNSTVGNVFEGVIEVSADNRKKAFNEAYNQIKHVEKINKSLLMCFTKIKVIKNNKMNTKSLCIKDLDSAILKCSFIENRDTYINIINKLKEVRIILSSL